MALILVSLQSQQNHAGALVILDSETGFRYLQIDAESTIIQSSHPRSIAVVNDLVYVNTSASLRIYRLACKQKKAMLQLQNEVILHEWLLGGQMQANLVALAVSEPDHRIFIGNNLFSAVDELDLTGSFVRRRYLWEIAPDIFPLPHEIQNTMCYGFIRNLILSQDGSQYIVVANCNNSGLGKVINLQTGQEQLSGLHDPHDGLLIDNLLYLHDVDQGKYFDPTSKGVLSVYRLKEAENGFCSAEQWADAPVITGVSADESQQKMRGMAMAEDMLFCGVSHFGPPSGEQKPGRIVAIDSRTGKQIEEYELPDLTELRQPRIFGMASLPETVSMQWSQPLHFFLCGKDTIPQLHQEEVEPEVEEQEEKDALGNNIEEAAKTDQCLKGDAIHSGKDECLAPDRENEEQEEKDALDNNSDETAKADQCLKDDDIHAGKDECLAPDREKVPSVIIEDVCLRYRRTGTALLTFGRNRHLRKTREFLALQNLSLTLYEEETVGLIGRNGSGKSTLSMMISGALPPDGGRITTFGKVHLLALGVGFRPEMTGRDNVFISGTLLGLSRREVAGRMDGIKEFSELGDFFDEPLRTYSSGMRSRLGFAVATAVRPDILILDEVMSTGDAAFRQKADERMKVMREQTKTVIIVSHNAGQMKKICSRVVWLEKGKLIMDGDAKSILAKYNKFCQNPQKWLQRHAEIPSSLTD